MRSSPPSPVFAVPSCDAALAFDELNTRAVSTFWAGLFTLFALVFPEYLLGIDETLSLSNLEQAGGRVAVSIVAASFGTAVIPIEVRRLSNPSHP